MTREKVIAYSILETLTEESEGRGLPSGHVYAALMGTVGLMQYQNIIQAMKAAGLLTDAHHYLVATDKARALFAEKVEA